MLFMVIERFKDRDAKAVYRRFREHGRGTPDGLRYVNSWIEANLDRCFQVMECDDVRRRHAGRLKRCSEQRPRGPARRGS